MSRSNLVFIISLLLLITLAIAQDKISPEKVKENEERLKKANAYIEKTNKTSNIDISGTVVDKAGNPLNDVEIKIEFSRMKGLWIEPEDLKEVIKINGSFHIMKNEFTFAIIDFCKPGYYPERRNFSATVKQPDKNTYPIVTTDLKIVLREIGKVAKMKEKAGRMDFASTGLTMDIFNLDGFNIIKVKSTDELKGTYFKVTAGVNENGNIIKEIKKGYSHPIPSQVSFEMVSELKDNGFIIVKGVKDFADLPEAPESGYEKKSIPCKITNMGKKTYFYYKNGKKYGKGTIEGDCDNNGNINIPIQIYENIEKEPSESRNLRSKNIY